MKQKYLCKGRWWQFPSALILLGTIVSCDRKTDPIVGKWVFVPTKEVQRSLPEGTTGSAISFEFRQDGSAQLWMWKATWSKVGPKYRVHISGDALYWKYYNPDGDRFNMIVFLRISDDGSLLLLDHRERTALEFLREPRK